MKKSGSITIGPPQNAVYNRLGNYNVTVTLEDLEGKTLVHTKSFKLEAPAQKIVANFELDTNEAGTNKVKEKVSGKNATFSLVSSQGRLKNSQVFRAGAVRKAASLEWDGSEKGIIVAPHIPFGTNGQFTMTGWLQLNDIQNNRLFGQDEWFGFTMRDGDLYFGQADTNAGDTSAVQGAKSVKSTDVTFKAGNWYFVAGIANGEELQLYVVDKANVTKPEKFTQSVSGSSINPGRCVFVIGGQIDRNCKGYTYDDQSNGHTGTFDEIRLYDRALSEGEIRALALMGA